MDIPILRKSFRCNPLNLQWELPFVFNMSHTHLGYFRLVFLASRCILYYNSIPYSRVSRGKGVFRDHFEVFFLGNELSGVGITLFLSGHGPRDSAYSYAYGQSEFSVKVLRSPVSTYFWDIVVLGLGPNAALNFVTRTRKFNLLFFRVEIKPRTISFTFRHSAAVLWRLLESILRNLYYEFSNISLFI